MVQRIVYPRPDLPQMGWVPFVELTTGTHRFWAAIDCLAHTSTSQELTLYASRER
jgi:hypothetical protein